MKKKFRFFSVSCCFVLCFIFLNYAIVKAQPKPCGNYRINHEQLLKTLSFERNNFNKTISPKYLIRVYFHVCRNNDGTNPGIENSQIPTEFSELVSDYSGSSVCFINMGFNYVNSTQINTQLDPDNQNDEYWLLPYLIPNCINVFYHAKLLKYGGSAYSIPNTFCSIDKGNISADHTISHETGHCLGLFHTFETNAGDDGKEDIDESNCASAGDLICDTKADPYSFYKEHNTCFSTSNDFCLYKGSCSDPKGNKNYSPPYTNMMAYWWNHDCYLNLFFSPNQFNRMNSTLSSDDELKQCESEPSNFAIVPGNYSSGYIMVSAVNTLSTYTSYSTNFYGTVKATLGGQIVMLEPGFHAYPSSGGLVLIEASSCNYSSKKINSNLISKSVKSNLQKETSDLYVYPNPTSSVLHVDFNTSQNEKNVILQVYSVEMLKVKEISLGNLTTGKHSESINLDNLTPGIYFVSIELKSKRLHVKVSVLR